MQNPAATIYCPNPTCETSNQETHNFCQHCRTPLPRRYLWVLGKGLAAYKPGDIIAERYWYKSEQILLDSKPGWPPALSEEIPPAIGPYLKLFPERLHIPQVYGLLEDDHKSTNDNIWLLEGVPLDTNKLTTAPKANRPGGDNFFLQPQLSAAWKNATALRQLHWLWQIAKLWQPFSQEKVASSLLDPHLIRVEGPIVRLLELQIDPQPVVLSQLGRQWLDLVPDAKPLIAPFVQKLGEQLIDGKIKTAPHLLTALDQAISKTRPSQDYSYQIATRTDTGPSRRRNEDSCYPDSGTTQTPASPPLVIVCDGIGGHEGGNLASATAIKAIREQVEPLASHSNTSDTPQLLSALEQAACIANDTISDRNNDEQRQGRQRMGTTVVMALAKAHQVYLAHVGDSRAYWITRNGCYQVTLDDDVASREVRLGYALYRDAVAQPAAGSLVQALGMASSGLLHPTVQRFLIDEDSIFLLCSDGLSDNDRVEQFWETEILPILNGQTDITAIAERLIRIANNENGHDNVTVGLLHCRVQDNKNTVLSPDTLVSQLNSLLNTVEEESSTPSIPTTQLPNSPSVLGTELLPSPRSTHRALPWLLGIAVLLAIPTLAYFTLPELQQTVNPLIGRGRRTLAPAAPSSPPVPKPPLQSGQTIRIQNGTTTQSVGTQELHLFSKPEASDNHKTLIPPGSVLKILDDKPPQGADTWLKVQVCWLHPYNSTSADNNQQGLDKNTEPASTNPPQANNGKTPQPKPAPTEKAEKADKDGVAANPTPAVTPSAPAGEAKTGWVLKQQIAAVAEVIANPETLNPEQQGQCVNSPSAVTTPPASTAPPQ